MWGQFETLGLSRDELVARVGERAELLEDGSLDDLRVEEFRKLTAGQRTLEDDVREFEIRPEAPGNSIAGLIGHLVRVVRLREVRALTGFTRIAPPHSIIGDVEVPLSNIWLQRPNWLPAVEVRGEGVFFSLANERLAEWEARPEVQRHASRVAVLEEWLKREPPVAAPGVPRMLLLHSLAHALMKELALDCRLLGLHVIRERIFLGPSRGGAMAGVLLYTSTPGRRHLGWPVGAGLSRIDSRTCSAWRHWQDHAGARPIRCV